MATITPDNSSQKPDDGYDTVVVNHPYFIYDKYRETEVTAGKYVACGLYDDLVELIAKHLHNDYDRYDIRRNG